MAFPDIKEVYISSSGGVYYLRLIVNVPASTIC